MLEMPGAFSVPCARGIRPPGRAEVPKMQEHFSARTSFETAASAFHGLSRHTTARDGGSAGNAGSNSGPYILYIAAPAHPCARGIPYILYIAAPAHPCARGVPYILYIKKPALGRLIN
ncbi:hypothetical protein TBH_C1524 [Thiolapillus brandeum]|uniref:Uncharacterized protein n=1 Tax=Thiolapillus brandeum TaxID=1076588 RepID=A0A7U6GIY1_9GAMM|nr:hypothetical protein TBH_C1524 [Thiolapillus brandeum]